MFAPIYSPGLSLRLCSRLVDTLCNYSLTTRAYWNLQSLGAQRIKNLAAIQETKSLIPPFGRSPGEGNNNPLQYSCLENFMDRGGWQATIQRVANSWTQLTPPLHRAWVAADDSCPQEVSWGRYHRNKLQTLPTFTKPIATGKISSLHLRKKEKQSKLPKDKMLRIPNYYRDANQNYSEKSNPTRQNSHSHKSTNN